jgi:hypothetical protein
MAALAVRPRVVSVLALRNPPRAETVASVAMASAWSLRREGNMIEAGIFLVIAQRDTTDVAGNPVPAGACVNRIRWDGVSPWQPPEGCVAVPEAQSGAQWSGAIAPLPTRCTNAQMRGALLAMPAPGGGTLFDVVEAWTKAEGGAIRQAWEYANDFERDGPTVSAASAAIGFTEAQLDALFLAASRVTF